jgi:hypothetical protein
MAQSIHTNCAGPLLSTLVCSSITDEWGDVKPGAYLLLAAQSSTTNWWNGYVSTGIFPGLTHDDTPNSVRYAISVYWVMQTMMAVGCVSVSQHVWQPHPPPPPPTDPLALIPARPTLTPTLRYGDIYPRTTAERVFAMFVELSGAVVMGVILAIVSQVVDAYTAKARRYATQMNTVSRMWYWEGELTYLAIAAYPRVTASGSRRAAHKVVVAKEPNEGLHCRHRVEMV